MERIMLVLTRMPGEKIHIGDDIVVTVLSVKGDRIRLGIVAPTDTIVDREEVRERRDKGSDGNRGGATDQPDQSGQPEGLPSNHV
jgi:carbon storage regulator